MTIKQATIADVPQIQVVRNSVTENTLSDPGLVTDNDCIDFITRRGKGWVCEIEGAVVGLSILDLQEHNVWALFVHPLYEKKGIGKKLHDVMLNWYFKHNKTTLWLGTSPGTRAETFYELQGWIKNGQHGNDEVKFEMTEADWQRKQQ